jgi:phenylalanyl-tRNA synthetase beta subunit
MDAIPGAHPGALCRASESDRAYDRAMMLRRAFVAQGLHEARSLTLVPSEPRGAAFTQTPLQRVKNPMIDDPGGAPPNLMHGLLEAIARNIRAGAKSLRLFEIGRTFSTVPPEEFSHAALVIQRPSEPSARGAREKGREADLFDLKGLLAAVFWSDTTFETEENPALALVDLHQGRAA